MHCISCITFLKTLFKLLDICVHAFISTSVLSQTVVLTVQYVSIASAENNSGHAVQYLICFSTSQTLAHQVTEKDLAEGRLYPPLSSIRDVSLKLAAKVQAAVPYA